MDMGIHEYKSKSYKIQLENNKAKDTVFISSSST
jgi:hypothetical protein